AGFWRSSASCRTVGGERPFSTHAKEAPVHMKKLIPLALLAAAAIVVPAQASRPADPGAQGKSKSHTNSRCKHSTLTKSYVFGGTLTANPTLTQTAGANTADASDDLFTVGLTLNVPHANK